MDACPNCTSSDLMHVALTLPGGPVRFASCRQCEHRWWREADSGDQLNLDTVLHKAAS